MESESQSPPRHASPSASRGPAYQPLVAVALAASAGILLDRFVDVPLGLWWIVGAVGLAAWLPLWRRYRHTPSALALLLAAASLGGAWHHEQWNLFADNHLGRYAREGAQPACVEVEAVRSPRRLPPPPPDPLQFIPRGEMVKFDVDVLRLRDGAAWRTVSGRVAVVAEGGLPAIRCGDRLLIYGRLAAPPRARNPGEFDMANYLRGDRRLCQLRAGHAAGVTVVAASHEISFRSTLDKMRCYGRRMFERHLQPRLAGLAGAVLLGTREQLDPEQTRAFFETGTIHLLVVSGLNVAMLAGACLLVLRRVRLPRLTAIIGVAVTVLL